MTFWHQLFAYLRPNSSVRLISVQALHWLLFLLIITLALTAGFFEVSWENSEKKYQVLLNQYQTLEAKTSSIDQSL